LLINHDFEVYIEMILALVFFMSFALLCYCFSVILDPYSQPH